MDPSRSRHENLSSLLEAANAASHLNLERSARKKSSQHIVLGETPFASALDIDAVELPGPLLLETLGELDGIVSVEDLALIFALDETDTS